MKRIHYRYGPQLRCIATTLLGKRYRTPKFTCSMFPQMSHYRKTKTVGMDNISAVARDGGGRKTDYNGWQEGILGGDGTVPYQDRVGSYITLRGYQNVKGFFSVWKLHSKKLYLGNCLQKWNIRCSVSKDERETISVTQSKLDKKSSLWPFFTRLHLNFFKPLLFYDETWFWHVFAKLGIGGFVLMLLPGQRRAFTSWAKAESSGSETLGPGQMSS